MSLSAVNSFFIKFILWALPINLGLSFWVGLRELNASTAQVANEMEAVGLALLLCVPLLVGWLIYRIFPANRSKLRSFIRFLSLTTAVLYAPAITWLNITSLLNGGALEEGFQVYVVPLFFGAGSLLSFLLMFFVCLMFTTKQPSYGGFD